MRPKKMDGLVKKRSAPAAHVSVRAHLRPGGVGLGMSILQKQQRIGKTQAMHASTQASSFEHSTRPFPRSPTLAPSAFPCCGREPPTTSVCSATWLRQLTFLHSAWRCSSWRRDTR